MNKILSKTAQIRIGIDARPLHHPETGIGRYTYEIISRLIEDPCFDCHLYSQKQLPDDLFPVAFKQRFTTNAFFSRFSTLTNQLVFPIWMRRDDIHIFWSPRHHLPLVCPSNHRALTVHDMVWRQAPDTMRFGASLLERLLMPPSIKKADVVFTPSQATKRDVCEFLSDFGNQIVVTPLGSLPQGDEQNNTLAQKFILCVGTLEPRKNLVRMIEAFQLARERAQLSHSLWIVGSRGWKDQETLSVINAIGQNSVKWLGPVENSELRALYSSCHFLLACSIYEGFGLPIVEAAAFGKPSITSHNSSMPEVAGDGALYADPLDVESICSAIIQLSSDTALYRKLSAEANTHSKQFTWEATFQGTRASLAQFDRRNEV